MISVACLVEPEARLSDLRETIVGLALPCLRSEFGTVGMVTETAELEA